MDTKELREREERAAALAKEDEKFLTDYLSDCIRTSADENRDIRETWKKCWNTYKEKEPAFYSLKEDWQSKAVYPKPFGSVWSAAASIKKAFSPNFLSIQDKLNPVGAQFWQTVMETQTDELHADFVIVFIDALIMALAVGNSMEMIPRFVPGKGLKYALVEPWKIYRDPDAISRDPHSGLYWVHQEWTDWFRLKEMEKAGKYTDVDKSKNMNESTSSDDPLMSADAVSERKDQLWQRGAFRNMVLVSEFWGTLVDKKGELVLDSCNYTVAGGRVIQVPKANPYQRIPWPGVSFSPMPDLLRFGGRGLLEGVISLWESICNKLCLNDDNFNWIVNPPREVDVDRLVDPEDVEGWPGKNYLVRESVNGNQAIRTVDQRDVTNSVLANLQSYDQFFQRGTFVTDAVQGLPGYRQDMTYRESAMLLDQSMGPYGLMGEHVERGCVQALEAGRDVIASLGTVQDFEAIIGRENMAAMGIRLETGEDGRVIGLPEMSGRFHVSGIQALLKDAETLSNIKNFVIPLSRDPRAGKFINLYQTLKAYETRTKLTDEKIFVEEEVGKQLEAMDFQQMVAATAMPQQMNPEVNQGMPPQDTGIMESLAGGR